MEGIEKKREGRGDERGTHNSSAHPTAITTMIASPTFPATKTLALFLSFQHVVLSTKLPSSEHPEISTGTVNAAL